MECIGKGKTASVYDRGDGTVLKLFNETIPQSSIEQEYRLTRRVNELSIPSPKAIALLEDNNSSSIVFEKLQGKTMLDHIIAGAPIEGMIEAMVRLHRTIQNRKAPDMPSYKEALKAFSRNDLALLRMIDALPEGDGFCHGDFHPGNIWIDRHGNTQLIDFMNACKGPKVYDVARTYFLIGEVNLPKDTNNLDQLKQKSQYLANAYLNAMGYRYEKIEPFYKVIENTRIYELNLDKLE